MTREERDRKIVSRLEMVHEMALFMPGSAVILHIIEAVLDTESQWNSGRIQEQLSRVVRTKR
jgi:hypothetical protein